MVTATTAAAPVLQRAWLDPGVHINAVGACLPDTWTVAGAHVITTLRCQQASRPEDRIWSAPRNKIPAA